MPLQWQTPAQPPEDLCFAMLDVPRPVVQTLYNRGLRTAADMYRFLTPDTTPQLGDPLALKGMELAVARLLAAIANNEPVAVYADFDVDGICSAVLLEQTLRSAGADVRVYIPHRVDEGYGLNSPALTRLAESGVRLLVTADCGTSALAEIAHANSLGLDVIVTDHHHVHGDLPSALAVINPRQDGCQYPFADLAGVGVAYKLAEALLARCDRQSATRHLDLVALGTVIDVAPLIGENRDLVRLGLQALRRAPRPGIAALLKQANVAAEALDAGVLGYTIGPRLNAAGRLADARTSYDLLQCAHADQAGPLAAALEGHNRERQRLLELALSEAQSLALAQAGARTLVFVASETFIPGILGLVAGRLAEELHRPTVAVERGPEVSRGSCRSRRGLHIARALNECDDLLIRHGGHEAAAGFAVRTELLGELEERLSAVAERELAGVSLEPVIAIDSAMPLAQATWETQRWLQRMEPFGVGNPRPVLQSDGVRVRSARLLKGVHLQLEVTDGHTARSAIAFRQAALLPLAPAGATIDIAYHLNANTWNGEQRLQLVIKDLRPGTS